MGAYRGPDRHRGTRLGVRHNVPMPSAISLPMRWRRHGLDIAIPLGLAIAISLIAQRWTGTLLDGQFYASLSLFGSDVTDRAVIQSYYWTRLGVIAPMRGLTMLLGTWAGFSAYRFLLILILVSATYAILRRFAGRGLATSLTLLVSLNTVVLSYFGVTYLTGAVMAGTAVLIAAAVRDGKRSAVIAGVALGWLAMANPPGMLLGGTVWAVMRLFRRTNWRHYVISAVTAALTFGVFLLIGRVIFPRMNWFEVYVTWNGKLKYSDFASPTPVWLQDISLLVPVMVIVVAVIVWAFNRRSLAAQLGFLISTCSVAFMLVFSPLMGGIPLEAPMYQAMLFAPAMIALALSLTALGGEKQPHDVDHPWVIALATAMAAALVILAGRISPDWSLAIGAVTVLLIGMLTLACASKWRPAEGFPMPKYFLFALAALILIAANLMQNSRPVNIGLYFQAPYANAFVANDTSAKMHSAVNSQEWLIEHTTNQDQILDWVDGDWVGGDRELYMVAGMQLWGENRLGIYPTLDATDLSRLEQIKPSVIAMFGPSTERIETFRAALPRKAHASAMECYDYAWPTPEIPTGHTCLTRLTWTWQ